MKLLAVAALALWSANANAQEDLSYHFGYALQAAMSCPALQLRIDTEDKVSAKYGSDIRGGPEYMDGLGAVIDDGQAACQTAWERYGCNGNVEPRLVQTSSQASRSSLCSY